MSNRRKLLFLTHEYPPYPGGVARYCASLAAAASRSGMHVTVVAPDQSANSALAAEEVGGVEVLRFPGNAFRMDNLRSLRRQIARIVENQQWDIVHAADWPMILAIDWRLQDAAFKIASLHGSDIIVLKKSFRARLAGAGARLKSFDRLVCNSRFTSSVLASEFADTGNAKIVVAPLGVDSIWFERPTDAAIRDFKALIDFKATDKLVLTIARVDERKGHLQTIAALARLPADLKAQVKYVCIGICPDLALVERMKALAATWGVRLHIAGALSTDLVRAAYVSSSVFALTAEPMREKIEGFGLVLLEAAAAGLPAVVTAVHAIPEVVTPQTGWICEYRNEQAIVAAITEALVGDKLQAMRVSCMRRAREFTWDKCAELSYQ